MANQWTFGRKVGVGFAVALVLTLASGAVAVVSLRNVVAGKDRVIDVDSEVLLDTERLRTARAERGQAFRGFLITGDEKYVSTIAEINHELDGKIASLRGRVVGPAAEALIDAVDTTLAEHQRASDIVIAMRRTTTPFDQIAVAFDRDVGPERAALDAALDRFGTFAREQLRLHRDEATRSADTAILIVGLIAALAGLFAAVIAVVLTRSLSRQISTAVGQVQSSSTELQAAASQQATSAKEQSTAMNEIATTISELLATSRQIAESAQRVAGIAEQTLGAARSGDSTVGVATESIGGIRRQVDLVVNHMLDLGEKSQQIGSILDIVSELAEQTNILAINATIEAAGAGDAGRRFGVVADEIRKLADRVAASTKEVRGLIEDVRGAVNRTVMATETGSKAVDSGTRQVGDVASAFRQIAGLVTTTSEAAREIELSTKQQTTAVEQVNVAIANIAMTTRETEASSTQTLQTVSQLATMSRDLSRLVERNGVSRHA